MKCPTEDRQCGARDREVQRPPAADFCDIELCPEGKGGVSGPLLRVIEDLTREVELYDKPVAQAGRGVLHPYAGACPGGMERNL
jgi:hypothetical protein